MDTAKEIIKPYDENEVLLWKILGKVKSKLEKNEVVIGSVVSLTDYTVSERLGFAGYGFFVDRCRT